MIQGDRPVGVRRGCGRRRGRQDRGQPVHLDAARDVAERPGADLPAPGPEADGDAVDRAHVVIVDEEAERAPRVRIGSDVERHELGHSRQLGVNDFTPRRYAPGTSARATGARRATRVASISTRARPRPRSNVCDTWCSVRRTNRGTFAGSEPAVIGVGTYPG